MSASALDRELPLRAALAQVVDEQGPYTTEQLHQELQKRIRLVRLIEEPGEEDLEREIVLRVDLARRRDEQDVDLDAAELELEHRRELSQSRAPEEP